MMHELSRGTRYRSWLRHYDASRKVRLSIPDEVEYPPPHPNPSSRTRPWGLLSFKQKKNIFLGSRARPTCNADNLTAICEPNV
jgi:hypothetical protein